MNKWLKTLLGWIRNTEVSLPVVLMIAALIAAVITLKRCMKANDKERATDTIIALQEIRQDSVHYWKDKYDREHAEKRMAEGDFDDIQVAYGDLLKEKARELDVKEKQIQSLTAFSTQQKVKLNSLVEKYSKYDTLYSKGREGTPDTVRILQTIPTNTYIPLSDSFAITQYYKKHGFLNLKKTGYIDVISYNEDTKITALQAFRIKPAESALKVRPTVSAIWSGKGEWAPAVGIGLEFKVLKLPVVISAQRLLK